MFIEDDYFHCNLIKATSVLDEKEKDCLLEIFERVKIGGLENNLINRYIINLITVLVIMTENDKELLRQSIVENIIFPYATLTLRDNDERLIASGNYQIIAIENPEDDEDPAYAYTYGLLPFCRKELLVYWDINDARILGNLLKDNAEVLKESGKLTTLDTTAIDWLSDENGWTESVRYNIKEIPLSGVVDKYCPRIKKYFEIQETDKIVLIELPDRNNVLPGETGYLKDASVLNIVPSRFH